MSLRHFAFRAAIRILHLVFLLTRGMTLGVRGACFDVDGRVFLVRHTYLPGWHLPGGGVERRETALLSLTREIAEEGNLVALDVPQLFHIYYNCEMTPRDHVLLYRLTVRQTAERLPDREIAEAGFFALDALPPDTTPGTRRRLAELSGASPPAERW